MVNPASATRNDAIVIATRGSQLALWQANWVAGEIRRRNPAVDVRLEVIRTTGDKITDVPLAQVGGKGLFVKEIEEALLDGRADLAVHSMKDVPAHLPDGLSLQAVPRREDPRDAFVSNQYACIDALPKGARVGSSSLRRQSQLLAYRPDLVVQTLRGNVDTRLKRLDEGRYDAILLAVSGMVRLGWQDRIRERIDPRLCLPAVGQGSLGLEARIGDARMAPIMAAFTHAPSADAVAAERAFLLRLEGGCQVPIAALAETRPGGRLRISGLVAALDGSTVIRRTLTCARHDAAAAGEQLADVVLHAGGGDILATVYADHPGAA